jgi:hypothetical protein
MAGQPPKYKTPEELQSVIDEWFESFDGHKGANPTMSGLAYHLGFADRQSLYDYKGREAFSCTIKRAILKIESLHENNLYGTSPTGSIFWLKNRDWKDKQEREYTGDLPKLQVEVVKNESK